MLEILMTFYLKDVTICNRSLYEELPIGDMYQLLDQIPLWLWETPEINMFKTMK